MSNGTASSWLATIGARATEAPDAIAVTETGGTCVSRRQLASMVTNVVRSLEDRGFECGDMVLFSVRPGVAALVLVLAVHELGGVLLPMDPGVCDALFETRVAMLGPRWVFAESVLLAPSGGLLARLLRARGVQFAPMGAVAGARFVRVGLRVPGSPPSTSFRKLLRSRVRHATPPARERPAHDDEAPAFIVCTSGTTARPKAVVHTRRSLRAIIGAVSGQLALKPNDVLYARDLHLMVPALLVGARVVIPRYFAFDAGRALSVFRRETVSHAFLVTRDCRLLLDECLASRTRVPDCVRSLMIGAAPVRAPFLARLQQVLPAGTVAWCVYGATEVLPIACVSLVEKVAYTGDGDLVGTIIAGVTVRIDEHGQLCVRGDRLFSGYAGEDPVHEHCTGDLARLEGDRIVLLGRAKDMIIRAEHNIYPALYEPLVERIPGVRRAALVGDFDIALADERVILVVEPENGISEAVLLRRVADAVRHGPLRLDAFVQPDRIVVAIIPESGRSHKIDKDALRRQLGASAPCA